MKVLILKTGKIEDYDPGYAARLVEQGKAVSCKNGEPDALKAKKDGGK